MQMLVEENEDFFTKEDLDLYFFLDWERRVKFLGAHKSNDGSYLSCPFRRQTTIQFSDFFQNIKFSQLFMCLILFIYAYL